MSQRFDLYLPRLSWLHRLDPRTKFLLVTLSSIAGLTHKQVAVLAGLLVLAHVILMSARVSVSHLLWFWKRLLPLLITILVLQPLFFPGPGPELLRLGPLRLTASGLLEGVSFALRAAVLAFWAGVLLLTTDTTRLVQALIKLGLPYTWGLTIGLALRYVPTTYGLFVAVSEAQQARGWIVNEGNLVKRARSYLPIFVATVIGALRLSDSLGLALAARGLGFTPGRTTFRDIRLAPSDWLVCLGATLVFAGLMTVRFGLAWGGQAW